MTQDVWNAALYDRFRDERSQPFFDAPRFVWPRLGMRVVDDDPASRHPAGPLPVQAHPVLGPAVNPQP